MMKKVWLVLLAMVLVFGLAVVGCSSGSSSSGDGEGEGEAELVEKVVFDLETDAGIQALELGSLVFPTDKTLNPIKPLVSAGSAGVGQDVDIAAVDNEGKIALKFTVKAGTNWGAGIDLRQASGDGGTGFAFIVGDNIKIAGEVVALGSGDAPSSGNRRFDLNRKVGSEYATIGGVVTTKEAVGAFEFDITLTEDDIPDIKAGNPAGIRLEGRSGGMVVQINTLKVTGLRPSTAKPLPAPVLVPEEENIVTWAEIEGTAGYKVYVAPDGGEFALASELPLSAKSFNLLNIDVPDGVYQIKIIAVGAEGVSKDSPESNVVTVTKVTPLQIVLYENGVWSVGITGSITGGTPTGGGEKQNFTIEFTKTDTTGKTRVVIVLTEPVDYLGGSVEGNDTMTGSGWVNHQSWGGFERPDPTKNSDTWWSEFTFIDGEVEKTIGGFSKIVIEKSGIPSADNIKKIYIE